jgi:hypothetical protein
MDLRSSSNGGSPPRASCWAPAACSPGHPASAHAGCHAHAPLPPPAGACCFAGVPTPLNTSMRLFAAGLLHGEVCDACRTRREQHRKSPPCCVSGTVYARAGRACSLAQLPRCLCWCGHNSLWEHIALRVLWAHTQLQPIPLMTTLQRPTLAVT